MDIKELGWPRIVERLERGEHVTRREVALLIRLDSPPPPRVMEWIADALEGNLKPGRPTRNAFDVLKNPVKMAALHVKWRRAFRKINNLPIHGTLPDDIKTAAIECGVQVSQVEKEYRR
jgi:hypothetical protein